MRAHNLETLSEAILLKLYEHALTSTTMLTAADVCKLFHMTIPQTFADAALVHLESRELIYGAHAIYDPNAYEIVGAGIEYVQSQLSDPKTIISQFSKHGEEWLGSEETQEENDNNDNLPSNYQTIPKFADFRDMLLVKLVEREENEGPDIFDAKETADAASLQYRDGWVRKAANWFDDQRYTTTSATMGGGPDGNLGVQILADGIEYADEIRSRGRSQSVQPPELPLLASGAPASDRYVELDDNSESYKNAVTALESATEAIRGANEQTDYDKEQVVKELSLGRQLLNSTKIRVGAVLAMILTPLYTAYQDAAVEMLRPVIELAISAIKVIIGL